MLKQLERPLLIGVGLLALTKEKAQALVEELASYGEATKEEMTELTDKLIARGEEERKTVRKLMREETETTLKDMHIATQSDLEVVEAKVDALTKKLEALIRGTGDEEA